MKRYKHTLPKKVVGIGGYSRYGFHDIQWSCEQPPIPSISSGVFDCLVSFCSNSLLPSVIRSFAVEGRFCRVYVRLLWLHHKPNLGLPHPSVTECARVGAYGACNGQAHGHVPISGRHWGCCVGCCVHCACDKPEYSKERGFGILYRYSQRILEVYVDIRAEPAFSHNHQQFPRLLHRRHQARDGIVWASKMGG